MPGLTELQIDLRRIRDNLNRFSPQAVMPMLKANAYGVGNVQLAHLYEKWGGFPFFGLSHVSEAVALRKEGVHTPLFVVGFGRDEIPLIAEHGLHVALSTLEQARLLEEAGAPISVHLDLNTGMHRFGCRPEEGRAIAACVEASPHLTLAGVMTHCVAAEAPPYDAYTEGQIATFETFVKSLPRTPRWVHFANTPAAQRFASPLANLCRIGLAQFEEALTLTTKILAFNHPVQGESVGYFEAYRVRRKEERIAILPVGYYDGLHLLYSGKGYVWIRGKAAPYVGKICMDFMMVDVTEIPEAREGDTVEIFGPHIPPEKVAGWGQTNVRELIACLGPRIKRIYSDLSFV